MHTPTPSGSDREDFVPVEKLFRAYLVALVLGIVALGLAAAVAIVLFRGEDESRIRQAMGEEEVRRRAVEELVERARGVWDSFPDPDVGRLLQPRLKHGKTRKGPVSSNRFGLRERDFAVPKPEGLLRVVILGDSFVFGAGVEPGERVGVHLERMLRRRSGQEVEAIHVGMGSWNVLAETSYLRRNLGHFEPDLVVHVLVSNDLDDSGTVRGFGGVANFTSQRPRQTTTFRTAWPINGLDLGFRKLNHLNHALGWESERRFAEASADLGRLASDLGRAGIPYLVVLSWADEPQIAAPRLLEGLPDDAVTFLPESHRRDSRFRISASDPHWNPRGHARVARFLYGAIEKRHLLAETDLEPWSDAAELFRSLHREGFQQAYPDPPFQPSRKIRSLRTVVDMETLDEHAARQIYGGIQGDGLVAPYAAVLLKRDGATHLRVEGEATGRSELAGTEVRLFADEIPLGAVTLPEEGPVEARWPLPPEILERASFDARFVADDYAYFGRNLRLCGVFRLRRLGVVGGD